MLFDNLILFLFILNHNINSSLYLWKNLIDFKILLKPKSIEIFISFSRIKIKLVIRTNPLEIFEAIFFPFGKTKLASLFPEHNRVVRYIPPKARRAAFPFENIFKTCRNFISLKRFSLVPYNKRVKMAPNSQREINVGVGEGESNLREFRLPIGSIDKRPRSRRVSTWKYHGALRIARQLFVSREQRTI